jgi:hypothetical protein
MDALLQLRFYNGLVRRAIRRERVFRDRLDPLDAYDDLDFHLRYRFRKITVRNIVEMLEEDLITVYDRPTDLTPPQQIFLALH